MSPGSRRPVSRTPGRGDPAPTRVPTWRTSPRVWRPPTADWRGCGSGRRRPGRGVRERLRARDHAGLTAMTTALDAADPCRPGKLSRLDRLLPVWIGAAMVLGLALGRLVPRPRSALSRVEVAGDLAAHRDRAAGDDVSRPGWVRYDRLDTVTYDRRLLVSSLVLNWLIGPALMFASRVADAAGPACLSHRSDHRRLRRAASPWSSSGTTSPAAIARLRLAGRDQWLFQLVAFAGLGWFLSTVPGWLGLASTHLDVSPGAIAASGGFPGIRWPRGYSRGASVRPPRRAWYEEEFLPRIGPWRSTVVFTVFRFFAPQGGRSPPAFWDGADRAAVCLFCADGAAAMGSGAPRLHVCPHHDDGLTAAGNNFELAIVVAIATFGVSSGQALVGAVGRSSRSCARRIGVASAWPAPAIFPRGRPAAAWLESEYD